ncbi:MAG TPA: LysR family transcriptional regulator [Terriglobales bacterium]|nr:LysR family transcriptional regulator [Terriglobales bacterium]
MRCATVRALIGIEVVIRVEEFTAASPFGCPRVRSAGIYRCGGWVMVLPEIRLLQAAITLAEELHFSRAAGRLHIEQSTLSRRILELEGQLGIKLFDRNHQMVELTEAGSKFVEEARKAELHIERAVTSAKAASRGTDEVLNFGKSPNTDPYLVSMILATRLPLFPGLRIKVWSNYSHELVRGLMAGSLDLAVTTGVPENGKLSCLKLAENPFYIAMSSDDPLSGSKRVALRDMQGRNWVMFSRHVNPHLYDMIQRYASVAGVDATDLHHVSSPEEAVPLIFEDKGLAFLNRTGAWRIAQHGITMRPLAEEGLRLVTNLTVRSDTKSRLIGEVVKATARKLDALRRPVQQRLSLSA